MIKVFIADDHKIMTDGVRSLLMQREDDIEVVGTAQNGREVIQKLKEKQADILLLDIQMPRMDGIETTIQVKKQFPEVKILILSMFLDHAKLDQILQEGISGYVLKDKGYDETVKAIRAIYSGKDFYSDEIVKLIIDNHKRVLHAPKDKKSNVLEQLSEKELVILKLLTEGLSNPEMAESLNKSIHTINSHIKNIKAKTGISGVRELISFALKNELGKSKL